MPVICQAEGVSSYLLAEKDRSRPALLTLTAEHTYGELDRAADAVAAYLLAAGGQKGDRVLLVGDNSFFWVAAYLGTLRAAMVSVPLPPGSSEADLRYAQETTEARFAFLQSTVAQRNGTLLASLHVIVDKPLAGALRSAVRTDFASLQNDYTGGASSWPVVEDDDLASLMFTSGSTGTPRAVMVTHGNIVANTDSIIAYLNLTETDRIMDVLPFHYCFGTSLLHTHLRAGGTVVIDNRFLYPEKVLDRMEETGCTGFAGVPSHYQILLNATSIRSRSLPHLRYVQQAGGHLPSDFIRQLQRALPGKQVFVMYGQTEATARLSYMPPDRLEDKIGSIGRGIPGVRLRVLNEAGADVKLDEIGEVVAEGGNVTLGYWRDPEETQKCFRHGRLYTGDLAKIDSEGFVFIVDRAKDFIKCGGKRVSCRQLESQMLAFGGLLEAAIIGVPDDLLGEAVKAFVVADHSSDHLSPEILKASLLHFCKAHMAPQTVPREIVVLESLPKSDAGKVSKQALRAL